MAREDKVQDVTDSGDGADGTFDCPVCGWPEIHSHNDYELVERPYIDGARIAFEKEARTFMLRPYFTGLRRGYNWGEEAKNARGIANGAIHLSDWAARQWPQGLYVHSFVEVMWELWRRSWISARRSVGDSYTTSKPSDSAPNVGEIK